LLATRTTNEENQHRHAGGAFAGLSAAMYLDKTLAPRIEAEVTLLSRKNFILFNANAARSCLGTSRTRDWRSIQMNANLIR
jgi:NADH dehydrogenase FAD-containing subunit